jgi:hypothetical protein
LRCYRHYSTDGSNNLPDNSTSGNKKYIGVSDSLIFDAFPKFDEPMQKVDKQPTWFLSYKFVCLLNLPETIAEFGPVCQWYKGKWLGERYVSTVKSERLKCPLVNLHYILLRILHCNKAVDALHQKEQRNNKDAVCGPPGLREDSIESN